MHNSDDDDDEDGDDSDDCYSDDGDDDFGFLAPVQLFAPQLHLYQ